MASFSNYMEDKLLDHVFNGTAFSLNTVYVGLFTSAISDAGGGTEVSGNGYARTAITCNTTNFPASSNGTIRNGTQITFTVPTGDWGTVTYLGLFDAATGGNLLMWAPLGQPAVITTGADVRISQNNLVITLD